MPRSNQALQTTPLKVFPQCCVCKRREKRGEGEAERGTTSSSHDVGVAAARGPAEPIGRARVAADQRPQVGVVRRAGREEEQRLVAARYQGDGAEFPKGARERRLRFIAFYEVVLRRRAAHVCLLPYFVILRAF